jgi:NodT family efflux transporter outer membrane factor (OMF) lipoprotein
MRKDLSWYVLACLLFSLPGFAMAQDESLRVWWRSFEDDKLTELTEQALSTNNALAKSALSVKRARLAAQLADSWPGWQGDGSLSDSVTVQKQGGQAAQGGISRTRQVSIVGSLSYTVDVWGKVGAQRDIAVWEAEASEIDRRKAAVDLTAQVALLYWQIGLSNEQIEASRKALSEADQLTNMVRARHQVGVVAGLDVAQAELNVVNQQIELARLQESRAQSARALAILLDLEPGALPVDESITISGLTVPQLPEMSLADGIAGRHDMQALELRLRTSRANVEISRAALYPEFTLKTSLSSAGTTLATLLQSPVSTLISLASAPLFNWKTSMTEVAQAKIDYDIAKLNFRDQMLVALREVADVVNAADRLRLEVAQREKAVVLAQRNEVLSKARFNVGATGVQPWIDAQSRLRGAQLAQAQTVLDQLGNRVRIWQALTGDSRITPSPAL